jgi:glycosidase
MKTLAARLLIFCLTLAPLASCSDKNTLREDAGADAGRKDGFANDTILPDSGRDIAIDVVADSARPDGPDGSTNDLASDARGDATLPPLPTIKKPVIYQLVVRYFGNTNATNKLNGNIKENGVGKFRHINQAAIASLKAMGITHLYLTGVMQQATATDYSAIGQPADDPDILKGIAGSFFAIKDYYDVCPDYADSPQNRLGELKALIARIKGAGMRVMMDFIPNHVARTYDSDIRPSENFGINDDQSTFFAKHNNFYYLQQNDPLELPTKDSETCRVLGSGLCDQRLGSETGQTGKKVKATGDTFSRNDVTHTPSANRWYETIRLNYGLDVDGSNAQYSPIPDTWKKMDRIIEYWQSLGIDGFRADWAHAIPNEFWKYLIDRARTRNPEVLFIAEAHGGDNKSLVTKGGFDAIYGYGSYDLLKRVFSYGEDANNLDNLMTVQSHQSYIPAELRGKIMRFAENHDELRIPYFKANPSHDRATGFGSAQAGKPVSAVLYTLGTGPILMLNGQEVGEQAAGTEGFDDREGHSTIFDYWSMPELRKWVNNHAYDGGQLSQSQKDLRAFYGRLMNLLQTEAISEGQFYGLNWLNNGRADYGKKDLYAYLRYTPKETLLVIANFSTSKSYAIDLTMPPSGDLGALGFRHDSYTFKDILTNSADIQRSHSELTQSGLPLSLPPLGAKIYRVLGR